MERLWHLFFQKTPRSEGVVTAADAGYFRELQFLVRSVAAVSRQSICVIDLGLTEPQRNWCLDTSNVLICSQPVLYGPIGGNGAGNGTPVRGTVPCTLRGAVPGNGVPGNGAMHLDKIIGVIYSASLNLSVPSS